MADTVDVRRLGSEDRESAVQALRAAFHDYPTLRWVLQDAGDAYRDRLGALLGFFVDARLTTDGILLGTERAGEVAGVALVWDPDEDPEPPALDPLIAAVTAEIGAEAAGRQVRSDEAFEAGLPARPHHYLGLLGVDPAAQGGGHGTRLVDAVASLAARHPSSTGVGLNTETPELVAYYRRLGFRIVGEARLEGLRSWALFLEA